MTGFVAKITMGLGVAAAAAGQVPVTQGSGGLRESLDANTGNCTRANSYNQSKNLIDSLRQTFGNKKMGPAQYPEALDRLMDTSKVNDAVTFKVDENGYVPGSADGKVAVDENGGVEVDFQNQDPAVALCKALTLAKEVFRSTEEMPKNVAHPSTGIPPLYEALGLSGLIEGKDVREFVGKLGKAVDPDSGKWVAAVKDGRWVNTALYFQHSKFSETGGEVQTLEYVGENWIAPEGMD